MKVRIALFSVLMAAVAANLSQAMDEATVQRMLDRQVIGSETTLREVQLFTERRIPRMPVVESVRQWEQIATQLRRQLLDDVIFRGEAAEWRKLETKVEWLGEVTGGEGYRIRKLRFEAIPDMWVPALLYEPEKLDGKLPVVMNVNGHDRSDGKAARYKQIRCINQAKRGMLALNVEWLGMGQLNSPGMSHYAMNQLDLCGTSGLAPFYLAMKRGLDLLLAHPNADSSRVGVAGLSGGGWQTIVISSLDTRVTLANPVAGYSSFLTRARHFKDLGDSEQTPSDFAAVADYTHLTAMLAPRAALLTYNQADNCCFEATYALDPLLEAAQPIYRVYDQQDKLRSHVNVDPGTHNFEQENREALYAMMRDSFYDDAEAFSVEEIDSAEEIRTKEQLAVDVPEDNATFNSVAVRIAKDLPRTTPLPKTGEQARLWQDVRRILLASTVKYPRAYEVEEAEQQDAFSRDGVQVAYWRARIGGEWTVPVTELVPPSPTSMSIVLSDEGRADCAKVIHDLLDRGHHVLAIDPFYFGESAVSQKPFLFAFMVATVGERPLGLQAGQLSAIARWARARTSASQLPLRVVAVGPRTSTIAPVAAAMETTAIQELELRQSLGSLKELIEQNQLANQIPEMYCFGLLEQFDILHLSALVAPRLVMVREPSERAATELAPLNDWYHVLGVEHAPFEKIEPDDQPRNEGEATD